jgi:pyroglutamyl-peptidase
MNPSLEVVRQLDGSVVDDSLRLQALELPCVFGRSLELLLATVDELRPAAVLALGLAGGRSEVSVERVAINIDDARIPDNAGAQPIDQPIAPDGPAAYFTTLPLKAIVASLRAAGVPAAVSQTAGTFVCNHVFYGLMHHAERHHPGMKAGFMHLPWLPRQAARQPQPTPSMALDTMLAAVRVAARITLRETEDHRLPGGALH